MFKVFSCFNTSGPSIHLLPLIQDQVAGQQPDQGSPDFPLPHQPDHPGGSPGAPRPAEIESWSNSPGRAPSLSMHVIPFESLVTLKAPKNFSFLVSLSLSLGFSSLRDAAWSLKVYKTHTGINKLPLCAQATQNPFRWINFTTYGVPLHNYQHLLQHTHSKARRHTHLLPPMCWGGCRARAELFSCVLGLLLPTVNWTGRATAANRRLCLRAKRKTNHNKPEFKTQVGEGGGAARHLFHSREKLQVCYISFKNKKVDKPVQRNLYLKWYKLQRLFFLVHWWTGWSRAAAAQLFIIHCKHPEGTAPLANCAIISASKSEANYIILRTNVFQFKTFTCHYSDTQLNPTMPEYHIWSLQLKTFCITWW